MGFTEILVPANAKPIESRRTAIVRVASVSEALKHTF